MKSQIKPSFLKTISLVFLTLIPSLATANDCVNRHKAKYDEVKPAAGGYCVGVIKAGNENFVDDPQHNDVEGSLFWLSDATDKRITRIGNIPKEWLVTEKGILGVYSAGANYSIKSWNSDFMESKTCKSNIKVEDVKKGTVKIELGPKFIRIITASDTEDFYADCKSKTSRAYSNLTDDDRRILKKYSTGGASNELTDPVVAKSLRMPKGRDSTMKNMFNAMQSQDKRSVLLWGAPGTGKTTIAYGIAKRIAENDPTLPEWIRDWSVYAIDLSLINEEGLLGKAQSKMAEIVQAAAGKKVILLMDEIHQMIGVGATEPGAPDVTEALKTPLADGRLCIIGTLTGDATEKGRFDSKTAFQSRFTPMLVDEPSNEVLIEIFRDVADGLQRKYNVSFDDESIEEMMKLTRQYGGGAKHPRLGISFLEQLAASKEQAEGDAYSIVVGDVRTQVGKMFNVESLKPVDPTSKKKSLKQLAVTFADDIRKQFIGQEAAITVVENEMMIYAARGAKAGKPPVFLFLGPSGVGKTYLAELTAQHFGFPYKEYKMEGFTEEHSISGLKGSPQGYVGSEGGGPLVNYIQENPTSILNFDEIDKAHPNVLQYLMGLMEHGRVQDAKTREAEFRGAVFLTSNFRLDLIEEWDRAHGITDNDSVNLDPDAKPATSGLGNLSLDDLKKLILNELERDEKMGSFIVGRIGLENIVIFNHLTKDQAAKIALIEVKKVVKRMKEDYKLEIVPDQALVDHIVKNGFSFKYGARPVRGMAKNLIEGPVARKMIELDGEETKIKRLVVSIQGSGKSAKGVVRVEME